jgi:hypothetical protein
MGALDRAMGTGEQAGPSVTAVNLERDGHAQVRYQPIVTVVVAAAIGIAIDRYARPATGDGPAGLSWFAFWWCLAAGSLFIWWVAWRRRFTTLAAWPLLVAAALTGAAWHHTQWELFGRHDASRYASFELAPVCVEAVARETPQRVPAPRSTPLRAIPGGERSRLTVEVVRIRDGTTWQPASGECQFVVEGHLLAVHPGDRLRIFGQFARISPPLNPGEFDFAAHARADRQLVRLRSSVPESVTVLASGGRWRFDRMVNSIRDGAKRLVRTFVGAEREDLAGAILLGSREGLTREETEPYLLTGTVHVLAV